MSKEKQKEQSRKNKFINKLKKLIFFVFILFIIFTLSISILVNFSFFRQWALNNILKIVNNELLATIEIDDLYFSFIDGIVLKNVKLITTLDTLANVEEIKLNLALSDLLNEKINIYKLELINPKIKIINSKLDSVWIYDLVAPSTNDTTETKSNLIINALNVKLVNADFLFYDSTLNYQRNKKIDFNHFHLKDLNFEFQSNFNINKNYFKTNIFKLQFKEDFSDFELSKFNGELVLEPNGPYAKNVNLNILKTDIKLDVALSNFNVFDKIEPKIEDASVKLNLFSENFNPFIIDYFYDLPIILNDNPNISISIDGNFRELNVNKLNLISENQEIYISGKLKEIFLPENFYYNLLLDNSYINENKIKNTLSNLDLKSIPNFNNLKIKQLKIEGSNDILKLKYDIISSLGNISGFTDINFNYPKNKFNGSLNFSNLDLSKFKIKELKKSNLNGNLNITGQDFDFEKLILNLTLNLKNSIYDNLELKNLGCNINIDKPKTINISNLMMEILNKDVLIKEYYQENGIINAIGQISLLDKNPLYNFKINTKNINLSEILQNEKLPKLISSEFIVNGLGAELDSLNGNLELKIDELIYEDRYIFPFSANITINRDSNNFRDIKINSEYIDANLQGYFNLSNLIDGLVDESLYLSKFIENKIEKIQPDFLDDKKSEDSVLILKQFYNIDGQFNGNLKDLSIINLFLDSLEINTRMNINLKIKTKEDQSFINIDSLNINYFNLKNKDLDLSLNDLNLNSELSLSIKDSNAIFDYFNLNLYRCNFININNNKILEPELSFNFYGDFLEFNGQLKFDNFFTKLIGQIDIKNNGIETNLKEGYLLLNDSLKWEITDNIVFSNINNIFDVKKFNIERKNFEKISLSGSIENKNINNLHLKSNNIIVENIIKNFQPNLYKDFKSLELTVDSLDIIINGTIEKPFININFESDSLYFNKIAIGKLSGKFTHPEDYITGDIEISNNNNNRLKNLKIDANYIPIYLGLDTTKELIDKNKEFDIDVVLNRLPLATIQPFAAGVSQMSGFINSNLKIYGKYENLDWYGDLIVNDASMKVDNTNLFYDINLKSRFRQNKLIIDEGFLKNKTEEMMFGKLGTAKIKGFVNIDNFQPGYMDIIFDADRLLVLSEKSQVTMPDLYGNFIISSGEKPIRFYGTLTEPNLEGDIDVMYAHVKMPLLEKRKAVKTSFTYSRIGDIYKIKLKKERNEDENIDMRPKQKNNKNIAELMNYNLRIKILGQFAVTMDMQLIGEMNAIIATPDKTIPLIYIKNRDEEKANLFGELVLKEPSIIKSLKQFTTSGNISFPSGSIDNPNLDLVAVHNGSSFINNQKSYYIVKMYINGPKNDPKVRFTYFIDGVEATGSQEQINEDALYLLALGRTKNSTSQGSNVNLINEGLSSGFSNFATKAISELLASTGVIQSAALDFRGGSLDLNQATVKFSGQLYGGISWSFGGSLNDISGNNELSIDIPASEFLSNPFWSKFVMQFTKSSNTNTTFVTQDAKNWEVKVKFGRSW